MTVTERGISRRRFVGALGAIGLGGAGVAMYQNTRLSQWASDDPEVASTTIHTHHGGDGDYEHVDYEEMDRKHEAGVLAFPAETVGRGGQPLAYTMDADVKVFEITCNGNRE